MSTEQQQELYAELEQRWKSTTLVDLGAAIRNMNEAIAQLAEDKTALQKEYDYLRFTLVPRVMDEQGIELLKIEGVGRLGLTSDINCSIKASAKEGAYEWLGDNGYGDLIQPTVNASSLKSAIKKAMADGLEVPEALFNISPFTRASVTKTSK